MTLVYFTSFAVTNYSFSGEKVRNFYPKIPKILEIGLKMENFASLIVTLDPGPV